MSWMLTYKCYINSKNNVCKKDFSSSFIFSLRQKKNIKPQKRTQVLLYHWKYLQERSHQNLVGQHLLIQNKVRVART